MKKMLSNYLVGKLIEDKIVSESEEEVYIYGVVQGITVIQNIFITIILGLLFGNLYSTIIFLCCYIPLRSFAGGYHASSEKKCFWYSIVLIIFMQFYFTYFRLRCFEMFAIVVSLIIILRLSPVQSPNKILTKDENKYFKSIVNKIVFFQTIILLLGGRFNIISIQKGILFSFIAETVLLILGRIVWRKVS